MDSGATEVGRGIRHPTLLDTDLYVALPSENAYGDERGEEAEGLGKIAILGPEALEAANPEGQRNPGVSGLAELPYATPNPLAQRCVREPPRIDSAHE